VNAAHHYLKQTVHDFPEHILEIMISCCLQKITNNKYCTVERRKFCTEVLTLCLLICTLFRRYLKEYLFIHQKLNSLKSATTQTSQDVYLFSKNSVSSDTSSVFPFIIMKHIESFFQLTLNKEFFKTRLTSLIDKTLRTNIFCLPFCFCLSDLPRTPFNPLPSPLLQMSAQLEHVVKYTLLVVRRKHEKQ